MVGSSSRAWAGARVKLLWVSETDKLSEKSILTLSDVVADGGIISIMRWEGCQEIGG